MSSTAVTLAFARRSRGEHQSWVERALVGGILLAWGVMFVRIVIEVAVVNPALLTRVLVPFVAMGVVAAAAAWWALRTKQAAGAAHDDLPLRNPFSLTEAAKFAAFFALVLLVVKGVELNFPGEGFYLVAMLAGLTDVDAITLSMAAHAITLAALSNTVVKIGMVLVLGAPALRRPILITAGALLVAGLLASSLD